MLVYDHSLSSLHSLPLSYLVMQLGMLVYDVFWVFGSAPVVGDNVMVTVATSEVRF